MNDVKLYHQCAHNTIWDINSLKADSIGSGLIFSPVNFNRTRLENESNKIKEVSFFDPQFYLPSSERKDLLTYDFYPNTMLDGGYNTQLFTESAYDSAEQCIEFQLTQDFDRLIIPAFYDSEDMIAAIQKSNDLLIKPYLQILKNNSQTLKPVFITAIITESMLKNDETIDYYLNLLTSDLRVNGIYLIPKIDRTNKRITNMDSIFRLMRLINILKDNDLEVHVGYTDIDSIILTLASPNGLSFGAYENSRHFSIKRFLPSKRSGSPKARMFSAKMLQWIDTDYINPIHQLLPNADNIFEKNQYYDPNFRDSYNWNFQKKEIYYHYYLSFATLIDGLPDTYDDRYDYLVGLLNEATELYTMFNAHGIILDANSSGDHISNWLTVLNMYNNYIKG